MMKNKLSFNKKGRQNLFLSDALVRTFYKYKVNWILIEGIIDFLISKWGMINVKKSF